MRGEESWRLGSGIWTLQKKNAERRCRSREAPNDP